MPSRWAALVLRLGLSALRRYVERPLLWAALRFGEGPYYEIDPAAEVVNVLTSSFVYFDLGKVLVTFDPEIACRQVAQLLQTDSQTIGAAMYDSGIEDLLESGQIEEPEFLDRLFSSVGHSAAAADVLEAMSAMFRLNTSMLPVVSRLVSEGVPMGILSNTCRPHWDWIMRQNYGLLRLIGTPAALSYEIGCMKPDPKIYHAAAELAGCAADQILFIDDRIENVQGATACGWRAIHYIDTPTLIEDLRAMGCRCFV
ncbi:Alpha-D-glucose-1-phosphate phosphatase YihX [Rosistilla ulvae]|uniref:Alpha-D-glucose-1-phosphate phosphatase YihX n=1 Tax=Rosistilla ulvae TaxID=1930277 RepID=A0A517M8H3_9BACT|nr:HAD family phosphatase [Rosistilla ulvae]QDS91174.1 Alpha-D-glucose-1-phosphate phosphatase YihX [Rosistilla ulvae]